MASQCNTCSRSAAARAIRDGQVKINGNCVDKPSHRVTSGDHIHAKLVQAPEIRCFPQPIPVPIIYEDEHLVAIDKPPGIVVHPAPGNPDGTLANGLVHRFPEMAQIGSPDRPGIVHRLDKDTSGVLVAAKTPLAYHFLVRQFKHRTIRKTYWAIVNGRDIPPTGIIDTPLGRHPIYRQKMAVRPQSGRSALTRWRLMEAFRTTSLLELKIATGRTHQIRVHLSASGWPVLGDTVYAKKKSGVPQPPRQMLHAARLELPHPYTRQWMRFPTPLPDDMQQCLASLR
jgi:23S rRNA pseudouridine1911/1915/1917 synthase